MIEDVDAGPNVELLVPYSPSRPGQLDSWSLLAKRTATPCSIQHGPDMHSLKPDSHTL